ncbi:class I adenylate-forming enzyme family protein [Pseudorhodoferax sp.]|uniref:class I adenylate-forming enzyme family protein n=1 Tax=Pseudorhodoferax sp. TaxID=1993553 RepID=UPI002DD67D32|nr:AMP-binding protein [Pseudorhodoferax sp.]
MRITDFLDRGASLFPDRDVVHDGQSGMSYRDFSLLTHRIANALRAAGVQPGERVALYSPNHPLAYAAHFGIVRAGAVSVPLNARNTVHENAEVVAMLDADFLLFHSSFADQAAHFRGVCPRLRGMVCIDAVRPDAPGLLDWCAGQPDASPDLPYRSDDVYAMYTTSGTTGKPKGVMLTHQNFECMVAAFQCAMRFDGPPVHLVVAPLTHAAGMYAGAMLSLGGTNVILPDQKPALILEWIERHRVSTLFLPPTLIYMLLADPALRRHDYSTLRYFAYGAAPMSADKLREAAAVFGNVFMQIYGQTEAIMPLTLLHPEDHARALADPARADLLLSCGRPSTFAQMGVMDDAGRLLPMGETGEVVTRSNLVMKGYYRNPEATEEVSTHGWHHTGDIGRIDAEGYLYLIDRKKDMIISGGFNIYPSEVEQVIWTHPAVQDCAVVGIPDEKWGEAVTAVVEFKPGAHVDAAELIALCKERIGSVKAPKTVHVWPALPRSAVGKVLKREIRSKFWAGRERAI